MPSPPSQSRDPSLPHSTKNPPPPPTSSSPIEHFTDLSSDPKFSNLFSSSHHDPKPTLSRSLPSAHPVPNSFTLYNTTLATPTTFRAVQSFSLRSCPHHHLPRDEWLVLHSLGTGLNGPRAIVHGGILMTMLDSAMAFTALRAAGGLQRVAPAEGEDVWKGEERECTAAKGKGTGQGLFVGSEAGEKKVVPVATVGFGAEFVRRVKAPCVVLVRAWVVGMEGGGKRQEGKEKDGGERTKIRIASVLEDGEGGVYVRAQADFVAGGGGRGKAKL